MRFILTAGQAHDSTAAADLLADRAATGVIADKAYDTNALRELGSAEAEATIPSKSSRKVQIPHDAIAYKLRSHIERFFNKLKHFRHIAAPATSLPPFTSLALLSGCPKCRFVLTNCVPFSHRGQS